MKTKFILSFFAIYALISSNAFSQEEYQTECSCINVENYNFLKLGAGAVTNGAGPCLGFGRRFAMPEAALEISINWMGNDKDGCFSGPKMLYLGYLTPHSPSSFYYGGGLGLGNIKSKHNKFSGLIAEAAAGYEIQRDTPLKLFAEVTLSHGMLPFKSKYRVHSFSPVIVFSVGAGF
jgi:hypothetical protein